MTKLILLAAVAALGCKMVFGRWPWELFAQSARSGEIRRAQTLLGLSRSATRDQVIEAHRRLVTQVHPDRGGSAELVHEANAARDLLLDQSGRRLSEKP
ncbi:MAG: DnaJ domain-containing protein [Novosphingobium sp.]